MIAHITSGEHRTALIGHSGFVGGTLSRQNLFSAEFNSTTIGDSDGQSFDMVVCAAAPGSMLEANMFPERDKKKIEVLIEQLSRIRANRFVLISSIGVLANFAGGDDESSTAFQHELAYGRHRRALEAFVEQHFECFLVVRLPALFGRGLRKNFIFDLLNPVPSMMTLSRLEELISLLDADLAQWLREIYRADPTTRLLKVDRETLNSDPRRRSLDAAVIALGFSATQFHHPESTYQYYDMRLLSSDISRALDAELSFIHLVSEPLQAWRIHERLTGSEMPQTNARIHHEDMRTRHAALWGMSGRYITDADTTLDRLATFFEQE